MKNKYELINNIKNKISIVDIISSYILLSKKGNNFIGICPFHQDSHPSLTVNDQKKIFKCFACNISGDAISFVSKIEHIGYIESLLKISNKYGINLDNYDYFSKEILKNKENEVLYNINAKACEYFENFLLNKENKYALEYLNKRKINSDLIKYFKIGFAPSDQNIMIDLLSNKDNILNNEKLGFKLGDINQAGLSFINKEGISLCVFSDRIMIPIYDINNKVIAFGGRTVIDDDAKYINTQTTKIFNKSNVLFNLNNIVNDNTDVESIFLVEGYMDVIALHKIGIKNVVATMGVALSQSHLETLKILPNLKVVNICFDNDDAGINASIKAAELLKTKYFVSLINYSSKSKDIDEIVAKDENEAISQMNNLIDFTTFRINQIINKYDKNIQSDRKIILSESLKVLKSENDFVSINDNVIKLCKLLDLDKDIILSQITNTNKNKKSINCDSKLSIEFENNDIKKPVGFKSTEGTEFEILTCVFMDRNCVNIFEEKCNIILNEKNIDLFNVIQEYYYLNPEINSINANDIKDIFSNNQELIPIAMKIAINKEKIQIKTLQERLQKTIDRHLMLIKKEGHKKIVSQMKDMNSDDKQELLKKIFKK